MARPYRSELSELRATVEWVAAADSADLNRSVVAGAGAPLVAVGSGGSLSAAQHLARLHRTFAGRPGIAFTPLALLSDRVIKDAHHWLFSAGGSNVDAVAASRACLLGEPVAVNAVTMKARSKVADLCREHSAYASVHVVNPPSKKDGFLATNSLLAFCSLMTKSYLHLAGDERAWRDVLETVESCLESAPTAERWREESKKVTAVDHLIVLFDSHTSLGGFDLESKLTEAGIKSVQLADYRHFAHGRHHWLAKNGSSTGVLAFLSTPGMALGRRTIAALPDEIPIARIEVPNSGESAQLASLLSAFYVTEELGFARGIDPGQPGVPDFGRKLYGLRLPTRIEPNAVDVSVGRKLDGTRGIEVLESWRRSYTRIVHDLVGTKFSGVVLDYDGTVVDTNDRFDRPIQPIAEQLARLLHAGLSIGIATGRGRSAGNDLRSVLPQDVWPDVTVGYYNGSAVASLSDVDAPDRDGRVAERILEARRIIEGRADSVGGICIETRPEQLTLSQIDGFAEVDLWAWTMEILSEIDAADLRVLRSSHSVDVATRCASKLNVVEAISGREGTEVLRIGDRGRWPGNDYQLLASPYGLSVDEVSSDPDTCWNLAPRGVRGTQATLYYLKSIRIENGTGRLRFGES